MTRRLKFDIPGPDWRVGADPARSEGWQELFGPELPRPLRLVVEIGFGRGEFLLALAAASPGTAFLGVEHSRKRVLKLARRLARTPLRNVRLLQAAGELVVNELLEPRSVDTFWINFPDPWPKKRHHRRRLLQAPFVSQLARRLRPGGTLHVATDHPGYAEAIDAVLRGEPQLANLHAPDPYRREMPGRMPTAYELEWRREGRPLFFWSYELRGEAPAAGVDTLTAGS